MVTNEARQYPTCRFCGRHNLRGISGATHSIYICFECIDLVAEMKAEHLAEERS